MNVHSLNISNYSLEIDDYASVEVSKNVKNSLVFVRKIAIDIPVYDVVAIFSFYHLIPFMMADKNRSNIFIRK